jgi:hypothetical protein
MSLNLFIDGYLGQPLTFPAGLSSNGAETGAFLHGATSTVQNTMTRKHAVEGHSCPAKYFCFACSVDKHSSVSSKGF